MRISVPGVSPARQVSRRNREAEAMAANDPTDPSAAETETPESPESAEPAGSHP